MSLLTKLFRKNTTSDERRSDSFMPGGRREGECENPYLSARRTWNSYSGSIVAQRDMWKVIAILGGMIILVAVGGVVHLGSQSKFVPYVIEVDKLGNAVASGPLQRTTKADPRVVRATVAEFITDSRLVTPDVALQRSAIFRIYSRLAPQDPATPKMNEWLNGRPGASPFERARREIVSIEIKSLMPQTPDTWQVDWIETVRDRNGGLVNDPKTYRALVTVYVAEPSTSTTEEQLRMNPLGIYVSDFTWQQLL